LGLPVVRRDDTRGSIWLDVGSILMLELATDDEPWVDPGSRELVAFDAGDRGKEGWRQQLATSGVAIEAETEHTLYFRDPDGRRIAVSTYPLPGVPPGPG
jgi:hypothetical protein